ncbi:MAG: cupredoxin family copper-binding protein [Myxococcota bacterium]
MLVAAVACALLAALAGGERSGAEGPGPEGAAVITIENLKFSPARLVVSAGTTVRWLNRDPFPHDVTSGRSVVGREARGLEETRFPDGRFSSGLFGKDAAFSFTFREKGEYSYYCNIHPFMVGRIVVE